MTMYGIGGAVLLLGVGALYWLGTVGVWRRTADQTPERAATIRAVWSTLLFVPVIVPIPHGAIPVPTWLAIFGVVMDVVTDQPPVVKLGAGALLLVFIPSVLGFFILRAVFLHRLRAKM